MRVWPAFLIIALALAGCGGSDSDGTRPVTVDEPTGNTISGVVVTPTIQPIPGATVTITPGEEKDTTDLFGRFRFTDLDAGTYRLLVEVPGYEATTETVVVTDEESTRPRIEVAPIAPPVARHSTIQYKGFIKSSFGPADEAVEPYKESLELDGCECTFYFTVPRYTAAITVEMKWADAIAVTDPAPQPEYRWELTTPSLSHNASGQGASPVLAHLFADDFQGDAPMDFSEAKSMTLRIRADETMPTSDQSIEIFVTLWEVDGPAESWSYVQGDT